MPELRISFTMPFLKRYVMYLDGSVQNKFRPQDGNIPLRMQYHNGEHYYSLTNDDGVKEKVYKKEIIAYGKHFDYLDTLTTQYGAVKFYETKYQLQ